MHQSNESGPSNVSKPEERASDAVLNEVLVNQSALKHATVHGQPTEDQDLALAKMLQEQERAFLALAGFQAPGPAENVPPPIMPVRSRATSGSPQAEQSLSDEEIAWRLMQEEESQFQQRMMAMAGLAPDEEDGDIGDDDGDDAVDPDALSYEELTALGEVVGTVACGLSAEQLAALPRSTFAAVTAARLELQKRTASSSCKGAGAEQCAVCRIEFEEVDEVVLLPCRHCYHPECISQWLQQKKVCPQCNKDVVEDALLAN